MAAFVDGTVTLACVAFVVVLFLLGQRPSKGDGVVYEMEVTMAELSSGIEKTISFERLGRCADCAGRGKKLLGRCCVCDGTGQVKETGTVSFSLGPDFLRMCPQVVQDRCVKLRMVGEGSAGTKGSNAGDLYVVLRIPD